MAYAPHDARRGVAANHPSDQGRADAAKAVSPDSPSDPEASTKDVIAGGLRRSVRPSQWSLWSQPKQMIVFLLLWDLVALGVLLAGVSTSRTVTTLDLARLLGLAACATVHIQFTRRQEERRRNRISAVHIDLSGVWVVPAALLLPIQLTLVLILIVRGQRWVNSRRPTHKFLFTSFTHAVSALLAQRFFLAFGPASLADVPPGDAVGTFLLLAATGAIYAAVQAIGVGVLLALGGTKQRTVKNVLGSKTDNLLDIATVGVGIVTTILLVHLPPAIIILVLVGVIGNRLAEISQLQEDARTDSKTGLMNMRGWTDAASRSLERSSRNDNGAALLMVDLDHFKWINDTYGHPAGDDVLRHIGSLLGEVTRPTDIVGRFGGEEFVVLLPNIDEADVRVAADRIAEEIRNARINTTTKHGGQTTVIGRTASVGVALHPQHGDTLNALLNAADAAVYDAKEQGRNQVRFARTRGIKQH